MKMYVGVEAQLHAGTKVVVKSTPPGRFTLEQRTPSTHWIGGSAGPTAGLNALEGEKTLALVEN
jgi:hypothetical protein